MKTDIQISAEGLVRVTGEKMGRIEIGVRSTDSGKVCLYFEARELVFEADELYEAVGSVYRALAFNAAKTAQGQLNG